MVLHVWNKTGFFPIAIVPMQGFTDMTAEILDSLNQLTPLVIALFTQLKQCSVPQLIENSVRSVLIELGPRGILTMLGFRKTAGSQDIAWPDIKSLKDSFNAPHTVWTPEELARHKNPPSKLTVGARALTKHCHRSSEGFWGMFRGSEA